MKRICILLILTVLLAGCSQKIPVLKTVTESRDTGETSYGAIYESGKVKKTEAFSPDAVSRYQVDCAGISCDLVDGKIYNAVKQVTVLDQGGYAVENELFSSLVKRIAWEIPHSIMAFTILEEGGRYFAFIKLNTNWSDPCELYEYVPAEDSIRQLAKWDNVDLVGIQLPEN